MKTLNEIYKNKHINSLLLDNKSNLFLGNKNEIIKGKIVYKEGNKTKININDKIISLKDNVIGEVDDYVAFKIISNTSEEIILKQLDIKKASNNDIKNEKLLNIKELFEKENVIEEKNMFKPKAFLDKDKEKERITLSKLKRNLLYAKNNINPNIINKIAASGININKIDLAMIQDIIVEVSKEELEIVPEDKILIEIEQYKTNNKIMELSPKQTKVLSRLVENNIPLTRKNINGVNSTLNIFGDFKNIDENTIINILKDEKPLTIENLYIFGFISKSINTDTSHMKSDIDIKIKSFLEKNEIDVSDENINICKLLIKNEIPIVDNSIEKYKFLKNIEVSQESILDIVINHIREDKNIFDIDLFNMYETNDLLSENNIAYESIKNINDNNLAYLIHNNIDLTIGNLMDNNLNEFNLNNLDRQSQITMLESKKNITHISLKMTSEASYRLAKKNINIETLHIKELLDKLNSIEDDKYISNFKINGMDVEDLSIERMKDIVKKVDSFENINFRTYKGILDREFAFTIGNVSKKNDYFNEYNNHKTNVTPSLGDNFSKVTSLMPKFLEDMNLDNSEENRKAFEILSKNNIDVNEENILAVVAIDFKIEKTYEQLHPNIIARMIKEGANPLSLHVDNILDYIDKYNEIFGETPIDKIENHILKLDREDNISKQTRESIVSVYRVMNQIKHNNSISIGNTLKHNQDLTLGNLFESSKALKMLNTKSNIIDEKINNDTGITEGYVNIRKTIENEINNYNKKLTLREKSIVNSALEENNLGETVFNIDLVTILDNDDNLKNNINESIIADKKIDMIINDLSFDVGKNINNSHIENLNLNKFYEKIQSLKTYIDFDDIKSILEKQSAHEETNLINNISGKDLEWFVKNDIKTNLANIKSVNNLNENENAISDSIKKLEGEKEISNEFDPNLLKSLQSSVDVFVGDNIAESRKLNNMLEIQNKINTNDKNQNVRVPIKINGDISDLNVHLVNEDFHLKNEVILLMNIKTKNLHNVKVRVSVLNDIVDVKFDCDDKKALEFLEKEGSLKFLKSSLMED